MSLVGTAFELGRHAWFALRRLITKSRNSAFTGRFWYSFLLETSQLDGRTKDWISKRLLHGPLWQRNSPTDKPISRWPTAQPNHPFSVAQHCPLIVFPLQQFLCWKFRNCTLRNKALVYLLTLLICVRRDSTLFPEEERHVGQRQEKVQLCSLCCVMCAMSSPRCIARLS